MTIAIAVRNEEQCLVPLLDEMADCLATWSRTWEVVIVDDGSSDRTPELLSELRQRSPYLRCFRLPCAQSKSAALAVAVREARGEWIVTFDGDLQNDPRDIPRVMERAGMATLVCGVRPRRAASWPRRAASGVANRVRQMVLADDALDSGCGVKVFPRAAVARIPWLRGVHRFLAAVLKAQGYGIVNLPINDRPRTMGQAKYTNWGRLKRTLPDLFAYRWWVSRHVNLDCQEL